MKHIILFLLITGFLLLLLRWSLGSGMDMNAMEMGHLFRLLLLGAMVSGAIIFFYQRRPGKALQHGLTWVLIALICIVLYAAKDDILNSLLPGRAEIRGSNTLAIRAAADGHFYMNTQVNGKPVRFMVDTGASTIILPLGAARRVGLATGDLAFTQVFHTANGQVFGAPVTLETLTIGGHVFTDVSAYVNQGELGTPLLGLRFLDRAKAIEIRDDELIIRF